jgi:hypothetical protein
VSAGPAWEAGPRLTRTPLRAQDEGLGTGWVEGLPAFDDLVASWAVGGDRPVEIVVEVRSLGTTSDPLLLGRREAGRWASVPGQSTRLARVDVDRLVCAAPCTAFRLTARGAGARDARALAAVTALVPVTERGGAALRPVEVAVEPLSQLAWAGMHPELDGGGASWCSPTALTMVLRHHGLRAAVPDVARGVYDEPYGGCGNWSLNVAHAAALGLDAVVTRLTGLAEARVLLAAGLPLVVSIAAGPGALPGFPLPGGTAGHLVVLAGIDAAGDPIVLDPAAADLAAVRRVYPARAFAQAWVGATGGITYLLHPPGLELPPGPGRW